MPIKTFRAASLQDALEDIRREMGADACVLETRQVRDGWMGWLGQSCVEVTAEVGEMRPVDVDTAPRSSETRTDSRRVDVMTAGDHVSGTHQEISHPRIYRNEILGSPPLDGQARSNEARPGQATSSTDQESLPEQLAAYKNELLTLGVSPQTVHRWISTTESFASGIGGLVEQPWLEHLQRSIARELQFAGPVRIPPGSRHTVALIGPTGVGKTTTVAKLAAGFRLESKRRVGLVTIDTFRIAAVQQLKAYAEIMDLPMQVVESPTDMQPAIEALGDVDLVLIDTAGRSPRSDARIDQLVEMLRSAQPDETHLVLSATSSTPTIRTVIDGFAQARPTAAILTKLDEAPHTAAIVSELVNCDQRRGMPISYLTNGQQVPDDIDVADVQSLLARLLPAQVALPQIEAA